MQQRFLEVWREGKLWYEFPADNEMAVREMLMKQNLDRICEIRPKTNDIKVTKAKVAAKTKTIDLSKEVEKIVPLNNTTPTPEKGTDNDNS